MFNLEAISTQRVYRLIADSITQKIRSGEFPVGQRLPAERELAEILRVSRSSVREALIALELSGYVEVRMGSGVFVTIPQEPRAVPAGADSPAASPIARIASDGGPFELLEARLLIEPECAALAAQKASDEQISRIAAIAQAMSTSSAPRAIDRSFHAAIAAACGNSVLESVSAHIWDLSEANQMAQRLDQHFVDGEVWRLARLEHGRIAEAIRDRDPIRARHAMYAHLLAVMSRLREDFADQTTDRARAPRARRTSRRPKRKDDKGPYTRPSTS